MAPITDYSRFFSEKARRDIPTGIKTLIPLVLKVQDVINFVPGSPNVDTSPFVGLTVKLRDGQELTLDDADMRHWQKYNAPAGLRPLLDICHDLVNHLHSPPCWDVTDDRKPRVVTSAGSCDALYKVFDMILNPGDKILIDDVNYPSAIAALKTLGVDMIPVEIDSKGTRPDSLRKRLSKWSPEDALNPTSDIPKLLYVVPHAQNPTGHTIPTDRKREIYHIAQQYNLIILEDDPYALLAYDGQPKPSLLSMDTDGRVVHVSPFSKTLNPGLRLGYICGPQPIMDTYTSVLGVSTAFASNLSQMIVIKFFQKYGIDGYLEHTKRLGQDYRNRKIVACDLADKYLKGLADWQEPEGGFYLWFKLKGVKDSLKFMLEKGLPNKIMFVPGSCFASEPGRYDDYIRCVFSEASPETLEEGFKRLRKILLEVGDVTE